MKYIHDYKKALLIVSLTVGPTMPSSYFSSTKTKYMTYILHYNTRKEKNTSTAENANSVANLKFQKWCYFSKSFLILQNIFEMAKVGNTENAIHVLATRSRGFFESRLGSTTESPMISLNDP